MRILCQIAREHVVDHPRQIGPIDLFLARLWPTIRNVEIPVIELRIQLHNFPQQFDGLLGRMVGNPYLTRSGKRSRYPPRIRQASIDLPQEK